MQTALKDAFAGRKALLRAYEHMADRVEDPETKSMLHRLRGEEEQEREEAERICSKYGVDVGLIEGLRGEVTAFLGKSLLSGSKGAYGDMRDLLILYGAESSGHAGARPMKDLAQQLRDDEWARAVERSLERSESHMEALETRIQDLARDAFGERPP